MITSKLEQTGETFFEDHLEGREADRLADKQAGRQAVQEILSNQCQTCNKENKSIQINSWCKYKLKSSWNSDWWWFSLVLWKISHGSRSFAPIPTHPSCQRHWNIGTFWQRYCGGIGQAGDTANRWSRNTLNINLHVLHEQCISNHILMHVFLSGNLVYTISLSRHGHFPSCSASQEGVQCTEFPLSRPYVGSQGNHGNFLYTDSQYCFRMVYRGGYRISVPSPYTGTEKYRPSG